MAYTQLNDTPEIECQLNRKKLRKHILKVIRGAQPPKTLAIHGTWGTGKTSLMAQLYTELGGDYKFKKPEKTNGKPQGKSDLKNQVVWFDAWQYQHEENILVPLLHEIRAQLTWKYKFINSVAETVVPGLMAALQSIDLTFGKIGTKSFTENYLKNEKEFQKERFSDDLGAEMLRKMLQEAISQLLGLDKIVYEAKNTDGRKLIVFIDDLDRCEPGTAYRVLEAIKVYLNLDNCLFVLGMDMQEVERMLAQKYEKLYKKEGQHQQELRNHARLYLEKICQDVFHLPVLDADTREAYFCTLLKDLKISKDPQSALLFDQIVLKIKEFHFLPPFPRSIKMLANTVLSHHDQVEIFTGATSRTTEFLILAYLYTFHYEVYQLIYLHRDKSFYNQAFLPYCQDSAQFKGENPGGHPLLERILLPQEIGLGASLSTEPQMLNQLYPHESLRQWLWIRKMVTAHGTFADDALTALSM
jgi:predicted KAP-like P-loop ATPase